MTADLRGVFDANVVNDRKHREQLLSVQRPGRRFDRDRRKMLDGSPDVRVSQRREITGSKMYTHFIHAEVAEFQDCVEIEQAPVSVDLGPALLIRYPIGFFS